MPPAVALDTALRRELTAGERVLWSAQPIARRLKAGFGIWLFGVPWTAFSLFWMAMSLLPWAETSNTPDGIRFTFGIFMPLFGLPFVAIGFGMLWMPVKAMQLASKTVYGLTNRRLIRLVQARKLDVASIDLDLIGPISRSELPDGSGHLRIETHSRIDSDGDRITEKFEVLGVPDVARLERLILDHKPA